ncbi:MAG: methylmalonyl-CoA epimerase [Cereibacter sphaeroides]|uniref:Methylmalonyl-CoA epimerase n=1 Tax=Cereibacter sphaeroides TaxID=1063 RepID=A0A2W5SMC8_CERSP|nr:MAG: methylmalonyl-CoA epimerase [Cereibacter sphaeroides]
MKLLHILVLSAFLPLSAMAEDIAEPFGPVDAATVELGQFLWLKRPLVVFADTPDDPAFQRQMARIMAELPPLEERDVVILTDTDPAARTSVRERLRPRGFSLVIMDKDGEVKRRNPSPWGVREITRAIDRFPLRRQEMLEQRPSGR